MSLFRMIQESNALVAKLGIVEPRDKLTQISVLDAKKWVVKTMRELRGAVAIGSPVDVSKMSKDLGDHLGVKDIAPIVDVLTREKIAFEDHVVDQARKLGEHMIFHEDHGIIDGRKYDDNQIPLSQRLGKKQFDAKHDGEIPQ